MSDLAYPADDDRQEAEPGSPPVTTAASFTPKEEGFIAVHAEFFRRPHDWNPPRAFAPYSTFRAVRDWLAGLHRFEVGPFRRACARVLQSGREPTVAELRNAYFGVLRDAKLRDQQARLAAGKPGGQQGCGQCTGRGFLVLAFVMSPGGRKRLVTHDRPCGGRYYETLIPCSCDLGMQFAQEHGGDLRGEALRRAQAMAYSSNARLAELKTLCGATEPLRDGGVDDETVAEVVGDEREDL